MALTVTAGMGVSDACDRINRRLGVGWFHGGRPSVLANGLSASFGIRSMDKSSTRIHPVACADLVWIAELDAGSSAPVTPRGAKPIQPDFPDGAVALGAEAGHCARRRQWREGSAERRSDTELEPVDAPSPAGRKALARTSATSAATAFASRPAAQAVATHPELWPETVRAPIMHSAEWTGAMKDGYLRSALKKGYQRLLRVPRP